MKKTLFAAALLLAGAVAFSQSLTTSLTACYALDGNVSDPINALTGTLNGAVTTTVNRFNVPGTAYHFNGNANSFIRLPNNPLLKPTNRLSLSVWVKANSTAGGAYLIFTRNNANFNFEAYTLSIWSPVPYFKINKANNSSNNISMSSTTITPNTWYHVAATFDDSALKLYVNGVLEATTSVTFSGFSYAAGKDVILGATNETLHTLPFNGTLDNLRFYNRILSPAEVSQLYLQDPVCASPAQALNFDGTNDFVDPNVLVTGFNNTFTYEFWARPTATHEIDPELTTGITGLYNQKYLLWPTWRNSDGGIGVSVGTNGVSVYAHGHNLMPAILVWQGALTGWNHIAVVISNKQPSLFINGNLVKTGLTPTINLWPSLGAAAQTSLGAQAGGIGGGSSSGQNNYYQGEIDEFRLWNSARTQSQIATFMNKELICPSGLVAYYKFNHGIASAINTTVNTATDYSGNNYTASLNNFALNSSISNWVEPGATINGTATTLFVSATATQICAGQSVTFSATGAQSYSWSTGALFPTIVVSPNTTTTYSVFTNCGGSEAITVSVNPSPSVSVTSGNFTLCAGTPGMLSASGAVTYTWQPGNLNGPAVIVSPGVSTIYTVTGTSNGCTASAVTNVSVFSSASITLTTISPTLCAGNNTTLFATGANSYTWQPGNIVNNMISVVPAISTVYTVTGDDGSFCTATKTLAITVHSVPVINATASPSNICAGQSVTFTAFGAGNYTWLPTFQTSNPLLAPIVFNSYTALGRSPAGCTASAVAPMNISPNPTVTITTPPATLCAGACTTLTASGASTYTWYPNVPNGQSISVCPTVTTVYSVQGTNSLGCISFAPLHTTTLSVRLMTLTSSPPAICQGNSATLTAQGFQNYSWTPGGMTGSLVTVSPLVSTQYSVLGTNTAGCSQFASIIVTVNPTPTISIAGPSASVCASSHVTLSASGASLYTWQPGGNTGITINVFPSSNTSYTVTGTLGTCSSFAVRTVSVIPAPLITVSASHSNICLGNSTTLTATGGISYTWQPGGMTGSQVTVFPVQATLYTVVGSSAGSCTNSANVVIITMPVPTVGIANPGQNPICSGTSANLIGSGALSYTWQPGGHVGPIFTASPAVTTVFTLNGSDASGCVGTSQYTLNVTPSPTVNVNASSTQLCTGQTATLTASGAGSYNWQPGGMTGNIVTVNPPVTTIYTVTGSNGNCSSSAPITITVNSSPTLNATASKDSICAGDNAVLQASGATTYTWMPGNFTGASYTVSPQVGTVYMLTGSSANGCTTSVSISIFVSAIPTINISAPAAGVCLGSYVTLTASGASNYTWMPGSLTGPQVFVGPTSNTTYSVTGESGGCYGKGMFNLLVNPLPLVTASAEPDTICAGMTVTLSAGGALTYMWIPEGMTGQQVTDSPVVSTVYTVNGTDAAGCSNSATVEVNVSSVSSITVAPMESTVCIGSPLLLSASGTDSFTWNPGSLMGPNISVIPDKTTTYTVSAFDNKGCVRTGTAVVNIVPLPLLTISAMNPTLCAGQSIMLAAGGSSSYTWEPGGYKSHAITLNPGTTTSYTLSGETGACRSSLNFTIYVIDCPKNVFGISNAVSEPVAERSRYYRVTFTVTAANLSSLLLSDVELNTDLDQTFPAPIAFSVTGAPVLRSKNSALKANLAFDGVLQKNLTLPDESSIPGNSRDTISYSLLIDPLGHSGRFENSVTGSAIVLNNFTVRDSSNNGFDIDPDNDGNPSNNNEITPIELKPFDFFIPEGFSPDGNGVNDFFVIKGAGGQKMDITIFNRWGNKVYEMKDYDNSWDGRANVNGVRLGNNRLPAGTYYYILNLYGDSNNVITGFLEMRY